jgi:hypothetical protein
MHNKPPATARWRKSTHSNDYGACVEVATWRQTPTPAVIMRSIDDRLHDHAVNVVAVRDSKDPSGPMLTFSAPAWQTFLSTLT